MSFFKKLFGGPGKKSSSGSGPMPNRSLNLQFPPIAENGARLAQLFVVAVKHNEKVNLNYSVGTLDFVSAFLQKFREEGISIDNFAETIFVAGCYVGEVIIKNNNGIWVNSKEITLPAGVTMMPIVVRLPNGTIADPIAKAFKRFHYGQGEDIRYFYHVFTSPDQPKP